MVQKIPSANEFRLDLPSKNLLDFWLRISTQNESKTHVDVDEWDKKTYIMVQVVDLSQQIYDLLGALPQLLGISEKAGLVFSITIPLPNYSMAPFVVRDSRIGLFFPLKTFSQFRWGRHPKSIAGYSATHKEEVLIPDLNNPDEPLRKYWVPSHLTSQPESAILTLPLCSSFNNLKSGKEICIAVLSISAIQPEVLRNDHLSTVRTVAEAIKTRLITSTILPEPEILKERVIDRLFFSSQSEGHETAPRIISDQKVDIQQTLNKLVSDLGERKNSRKRALKTKRLLEAFIDAGNKGLASQELFHFFEESPNKARRVASEVANLNKRFLKDREIQISGTIVYRVGAIRKKAGSNPPLNKP